MTKYQVFDEDGKLMRVFDCEEAAEHWCNVREGYSLKVVKTPRPKRPKLDLSKFEEAPF